jgi:RNA-directed DNA polymerase
MCHPAAPIEMKRRSIWSTASGASRHQGFRVPTAYRCQTIRKRLQTKLNDVKAELQRRMHEPIPEQGKWLQAVVRGHIRYYGVPRNQNALWIFRFQVGRLWHRALSRRSQNGRVLWNRMRRLIARWLPLPIVCHPYPLRRMGVVT